MDHPVTGSVRGRRGAQGPLDDAKVWAMEFIQGMVTLQTMNEMAERIKTIDVMMKLPMIQSGSTFTALEKRLQYRQEMEEMEEAIKILCALTEVPEA